MQCVFKQNLVCYLSAHHVIANYALFFHHFGLCVVQFIIWRRRNSNAIFICISKLAALHRFAPHGKRLFAFHLCIALHSFLHLMRSALDGRARRGICKQQQSAQMIIRNVRWTWNSVDTFILFEHFHFRHVCIFLFFLFSLSKMHQWIVVLGPEGDRAHLGLSSKCACLKSIIITNLPEEAQADFHPQYSGGRAPPAQHQNLYPKPFPSRI